MWEYSGTGLGRQRAAGDGLNLIAGCSDTGEAFRPQKRAVKWKWLFHPAAEDHHWCGNLRVGAAGGEPRAGQEGAVGGAGLAQKPGVRLECFAAPLPEHSTDAGADSVMVGRGGGEP